MKKYSPLIRTSKYFDHTFTSEMSFSDQPVINLSEFIFKKINHRNENSDIILSHDENTLVRISLKRLRYIVFSLYVEFKNKNINPGQIILLASISGNNELFTSLLFVALSSYGVKVLLPMYIETNELLEWFEITSCSSIIIPEKEIFSLNHHENEKSIINYLKEIAEKKNFPCFDIFEDFHLHELLYDKVLDIDYINEPIVRDTIINTNQETEVLLITTSGSSGKSKIVVYDQGGFIKSCMSWQQAGFYDDNKLGGRGFTPLFTHTMGIRAFFNALWTGVPVCLIKTEWFEKKPEKVRYFLMQMKPAHITGGPSVYNLLLELIRNFPELKGILKKNLKTVISSGSVKDSTTVARIKSSFDLTMYNAYGTTESQQVMNTLLCEQPTEDEICSMGLLLPGVKVGLKKLQHNDELYRLYVSSEFGMKRNLIEYEINELVPDGFFNTGDLVTLKDKNIIHYYGRENIDFFKDGFGVKIPLKSMKIHYKKLYDIIDHIEYFPLKSTPGLAVLIFITNDSIQEGIMSDKALIKKYSSLIESINIHLNKILEPFEYRHRVINKFVIVNAEVPKTVKGNPSQYKINSLYNDVILRLIDDFSHDRAIKELKPISGIANLFTRYHNPYIGQLLSALCMDNTYHKGKKDSLFTYQNGKEIEILDITGGYGTNLLGHNNDEIKSAVTSFIQLNEVSISDQGSIQKYTGILAEKLNLMVGGITGQSYTVLFGSTGSEAVEIALHHALFEWRKKIEDLEQSQYQKYGVNTVKFLRDTWELNKIILSKIQVHVIALKNSFHGSTTASRSLLYNTKKREAFKNILGISPIFIDDDSSEWNEQLEREIEAKTIKLHEVVYQNNKYIRREFTFSTVIAAIAEPIIGEGGIRLANPEVLKSLSKFDFPLIMDEIQCGLGRSGSFLASKGINANYYLFGKSLGGNIEKISAVLIENNRYKYEFGEYYTSTFSNGGLSANVALKTLSIITDRNIPEKAKVQGEKITKKLAKIRKKYPNVISEISGTGLMQGIRFCDLSDDPSTFLRNMYINEYCGLLYSSYLLKVHGVRIFPTLSAPNILRVEPSSYITDSEIDKFAESIEDLADKIDKKQFYELFSPLLDGDSFDDNKGKMPEQGFMVTSLEKASRNAVKVAIIGHFVYPTEELRILEREFCKASDTGLRILFNRLQLLLQIKPFVLLQRNLYGGKIHLTFINIPLDSAELERLYKQNNRKKIVTKIQEAVDMAEEMGIKVLSLGAYISIISNNGLALVEPTNTKIITGNTLTAASGIRRLIEQIKSHTQFLENNTLGVIGASGNIGSMVTEGLLESDILFKKIYLIGRNKSRLSNTLDYINQSIILKNRLDIEITTNLSSLKQCNIIILASNTNDPIIFPHHLSKEFPIIISDLSIPAAISKEVTFMPNVINVPFASYIHLPEDSDFIISSHTPKGAVFCCVAEAILFGLEPFDLKLKGKVTRNGINTMTKLAEKYGFFDNMGAVKTYKPSF